MELYQNIRNRRKELRMSQDELARKAGYTDRSSIAKIENGDVDLPQSKIMAIARALDIDPGTLMGNDGITEADYERGGRIVANAIMSERDKTALDNYLELTDADKEMVISMIDRLHAHADP